MPAPALGFAIQQPVGGLPLSMRRRFALWDTWINRPDLFSQRGVLFSNIFARGTASPPPSGNAYLRGNAGGSYLTYFTMVLPPGSVVTAQCWVKNNSGGGTTLRVRVQSGSTFFGSSGPASWLFGGPIVATVGTDGLWILEGLFEYQWADLSIFVTLPG